MAKDIQRILIVGSGPVGCYVARLLKEKDQKLDIRIIEEHSEIGRPVHCAGLVSKDVFSQMQFDLKGSAVINRIDGAEFFLNGDNFTIARKDVALVIDREQFDQALGSGLGIDFDTRFMGIEKEREGYLVETDRKEYYADVVIGADGAASSVRRVAGFAEELSYLRGAQFRIKHTKRNSHFVSVYLKSPSFAWVIPEGDETVRAGIISQNPYHDLIDFLQEHHIEGDILEKFAGVVPLGRCASQNGNIFLVGDAACQVKPLTHGGVYYGMRCAEILAECLASRRFPEYEKLWRSRFGNEINVGLKVRQLYQRLSKDNLQRLFSVFKDNASLLEEFGDFENHSKVISAIIRNTSFQSMLGKIFIDLIRETVNF